MRKININMLPKSFSFVEQCTALAILEEAENAARAYDGDFTSSWLLSPIYSHTWNIRKGEETRYIDGTLVGHYAYRWSTKLHDGSNLTDPKNQQLLQGMQRLAFLARELPGGPKTFTSHKNFLWSLNFLVRWAFVHTNELHPCSNYLTKITHEHFKDFFSDLARGGTVFALRYPERFLNVVFPMALGRPPSFQELQEPFELSPDVCDRVANWLKANGYMGKKNRSQAGCMVLHPTSVALLIDVDADTVCGGPKWLAFMRQFDFRGYSATDYDLIHGASPCRREMSTQRTLSVEEAKNKQTSESSLHKYFTDIKLIISLYRHQPEICPNPTNFRPKELAQFITNITSKEKHTPWIPLPIAMTYTNEALRWVHVYGEDLILTFLKAYRELLNNGLLTSGAIDQEHPPKTQLTKSHKKLARQREQLISSTIFPESIRPLNITGFGCYGTLKGQKAFQKLRNSPSLMDAITVLVGSIVVVVTMTKPMRESEFRALKRDCLSYVEDDGYWLSHVAAKKNTKKSGNNFDRIPSPDDRPIPVIAAKALQLLKMLTDGIKNIIGVTDPWLLESLVTLPPFGHFEASVSVPTSSRLLQILDAFCDYVAVPPDTQGRRWYIRVHEMRKSFLITFFWTFRYSSLDASRWIAGHRDASHIYAYIQANFPGEELPSLEAEYASQVLREYSNSGNLAGIRDVELLYKSVCEHFTVNDVSWIDEKILLDWLELQFESREFEIIPHSIKNPDGGLNTEISFRVSPVKQEGGNNE